MWIQNVYYHSLKLTPGSPLKCKAIWLTCWQAPATQTFTVGSNCFYESFKSKENLSSTTLKSLISIRRYLRGIYAAPFANRKNCWHSRAAKHIKNILSSSEFITYTFITLLKTLASFIIYLHSGIFVEERIPFIHRKNTEITYFSFKKAYQPSLSAFIFIFFTLFIYFETVCSVLFSSSYASAYFSQALDQEQKFLDPPLGSPLFPSTEDLWDLDSVVTWMSSNSRNNNLFKKRFP